MKRMSVSAALLLAACVAAVALSRDVREQACGGAEGWLASSLTEMETVKAGMTREELLKVFTRQGGLSTRTRERFVYRRCQLMHVEVEFEPAGAGPQASPEDKIKSVSEPILGWMRAD